MLWRLYRRYDRLQEPWRFIIFMAFLMPVMITATNPYSAAVAAIGWVTLVFVLVTRFWYHYARPISAKRRQDREAASSEKGGR